MPPNTHILGPDTMEGGLGDPLAVAAWKGNSWYIFSLAFKKLHRISVFISIPIIRKLGFTEVTRLRPT